MNSVCLLKLLNLAHTKLLTFLLKLFFISLHLESSCNLPCLLNLPLSIATLFISQRATFHHLVKTSNILLPTFYFLTLNFNLISMHWISFVWRSFRVFQVVRTMFSSHLLILFTLEVCVCAFYWLTITKMIST